MLWLYCPNSFYVTNILFLLVDSRLNDQLILTTSTTILKQTSWLTILFTQYYHHDPSLSTVKMASHHAVCSNTVYSAVIMENQHESYFLLWSVYLYLFYLITIIWLHCAEYCHRIHSCCVPLHHISKDIYPPLVSHYTVRLLEKTHDSVSRHDISLRSHHHSSRHKHLHHPNTYIFIIHQHSYPKFSLIILISSHHLQFQHNCPTPPPYTESLLDMSSV